MQVVILEKPPENYVCQCSEHLCITCYREKPSTQIINTDYFASGVPVLIWSNQYYVFTPTASLSSLSVRYLLLGEEMSLTKYWQ